MIRQDRAVDVTGISEAGDALASGWSKGEQCQQRGNPKTETRNPKEGRNPKSENSLIQWAAVPLGWLWIRTSGFGLLSAFGIRISDLEWPGPSIKQPRSFASPLYSRPRLNLITVCEPVFRLRISISSN
jgi:hypothetical protein